MASTTTRTLVLGVALTFEPANGYQLRRELLSWGVEEWAHINPGSIYSMLTSLTREGLLERHDLADGKRNVAVYTVSDAGKAEWLRLLREAVVTVNAMDPAGFRVAISFAPFIPRPELIDALRARERRIAEVRADLDGKIAQIRDQKLAPPHVIHTLTLEVRLLDAEAEWLGDFLPRLESGELRSADEPGGSWTWMPPTEDPGWQMDAERRRYREQLDDLSNAE
jgi:DNA-binding PadR family transcriptional regulator